MKSLSHTSDDPVMHPVTFHLSNPRDIQKKQLSESIFQVFISIILNSSKAGVMGGLSVLDLANFSSVNKAFCLKSNQIWKNLLLHHNQGFLKPEALTSPTIFKVSFLIMNRLGVSFDNPHLICELRRNSPVMEELYDANKSKIKLLNNFNFIPFRDPKSEDFIQTFANDVIQKKNKLLVEGWTPLVLATRARDTELMHALIRRGSELKNLDLEQVGTENRQTALMWAIENKDEASVSALLEARADPNTTDFYGNPALNQAVTHGIAAIVRLLLNHGANIESRHALLNITPIMCAVTDQDEEVAEILLEHRASLEVRNNSGKNPLENAMNYSKTYHNQRIINFFKKHMNKQD